MNWKATVVIACALAATLASAAPTYNERGRCTAGCNYYEGDSGHIWAVEKYHLGPAKQKLSDGRTTYAMQDIEFMLRHFPNNPNALMLLEPAAQRLGQPDMPVRYFKQAIDAYPDEAMTYLVYGMYLQKRGQTGDAIAQYQRALALNPKLPDGHYNLGLALVKSKRYAEANAHAVSAYQLGHPMPGLRNQLQRAGAWNPDATPATGSAEKAAPETAKNTAPDAPAKTDSAAQP